MKATEELKSLRTQSSADLVSLLNATRAELFRARFAAVTDPVDHPHKIQEARRKIARINTVIRQRALAAAAKVADEAVRAATTEFETAKKGVESANVELKTARADFKKSQAKKTGDRKADKKALDSARKVLETADGKAYGAAKRFASASLKVAEVESDASIVLIASRSQEPVSEEVKSARRARKKAVAVAKSPSEAGK